MIILSCCIAFVRHFIKKVNVIIAILQLETKAERLEVFCPHPWVSQQRWGSEEEKPRARPWLPCPGSGALFQADGAAQGPVAVPPRTHGAAAPQAPNTGGTLSPQEHMKDTAWVSFPRKPPRLIALVLTRATQQWAQKARVSHRWDLSAASQVSGMPALAAYFSTESSPLCFFDQCYLWWPKEPCPILPHLSLPVQRGLGTWWSCPGLPPACLQLHHKVWEDSFFLTLNPKFDVTVGQGQELPHLAGKRFLHVLNPCRSHLGE